MAIKPLRRSDVSSSAATTPTSPISVTTTSFPHSSQSRYESIEEPSEYDNLNYEEDGGPVRGEGTGLTDRDVEMGFMGSSSLLLPPAQYQRSHQPSRASSIHSSVHASVRSSIKQSKRLATRVWQPIKEFLLKLKLLYLIIIYSIFGAYLFIYMEVPADLADKEEAYHARLIARENLYMSLNQIHNENSESRYDKWKSTILQFEEESGLGEPSVETAWTFWMSFLYAGTLYTTIGYGNIACKTKGGKVATMVYAMVGIPIMIFILNDLGSFLLRWVKKISAVGDDLWLFFVVNCCGRRFAGDPKKRRRYLEFINRYSFLGGRTFSVTSLSSVKDEVVRIEGGEVDQGDGLPEQDLEVQQTIRADPPVISSLIATVAWIVLSARFFCIWEDWDLFTSFYFFVISLSTIGLGDVTPAHPEYMIVCFGVVLVGLAMVTVFIDVVKEYIENLYMSLLEKQLELYMQRVDAGDDTAAEQMMEQLQKKSKYLFPLMSKSSGTKVMNQFKKEARERGIEVPSVLTDINPETGLPAFATGNKEDFKELIEQAEERREKEEQKEKQIQQIIESRRVGRTPLGSAVNIPVVQESLQRSAPPLPSRPTDLLRTESQILIPSVAAAVQTSVDPTQLDDFSFGAQFSPSTSDFECQTDVCESSDEGIQTWASMEDVSTQMEKEDVLRLEGRRETSCAVQAAPIFVTTGIQPEVSSIFSGAILSSSEEDEDEEMDEEDEGVEEVEEWVTDEEDLEKQIREKIEKLHSKSNTTQEQRENLVRRHIKLFEQQNKSGIKFEPVESKKDGKKDGKKEIEVKEGTTRKLRELFERTGSASSSAASPAPKRKQGITVDDNSSHLSISISPKDQKSLKGKGSKEEGMGELEKEKAREDDGGEGDSDEKLESQNNEKRRSRKKVKSDAETEVKRRGRKTRNEEEAQSEDYERLHLYSGTDSCDDGMKRSDSFHSNRSISSMSSAEFLMHAGSLQRRKDSESRREAERKRVEERRRLLEREGAVDGGNTSMDEIETLKDIKKKLIKKTMLKKKKSSQDSETSVHRKKSRDEEKAERRKQRSELRFLKNVGLQTDFASSISSKSSIEITTQTHGTKKASRRSQTKLTSIEKPSTAALQHPLSIRRKISLPSPDLSRLSIVSLGSPSSPLDLLDISIHGLRDLSPIPSEGTFEIPERPSKLPMEEMEMNGVKMRKKSEDSEVEKRLKRRRRKADASACETVRESLSSASSLTSLVSPDTNWTVDEDGVRVAEVSIDVYLFNGQLDQSGYQFVVDPIEGRREGRRGRDNGLLPSSDGIKRIEIRYDWEEEELEDEEDEIMGKSGMEIVGEEDDVEAWSLAAETQTEWASEERGIQLREWEIEGWSRDSSTQCEELERKIVQEVPSVRIPPETTEVASQTSQNLAFDKGSQADSPDPETIPPVCSSPSTGDQDTQTDDYEKRPSQTEERDEISQTDPFPLPVTHRPETIENFSQTDILPSPPSPVPPSLDQSNSCAQTENVSPLLESQPCLAEGSTQTEEDPSPLLPSIREESCESEKELAEGWTQTETIEEPEIPPIPPKKESEDSETQCEIRSEWKEIQTQTEEEKKEEIVKETQETQYERFEGIETSSQTEKDEEKEENERIHQEPKETSSREVQTEDLPEEKKEVSTMGVEMQTEIEERAETERDEKKTQYDSPPINDSESQTEAMKEVETCDQGAQSESPSSHTIECQTDEEKKKEEQRPLTLELETQTENEIEEKAETLEKDCQTEDERGDVVEKDCQTEEEKEETIERDCQTEESKEAMEEKDCQTEERDVEEKDSQTEEERGETMEIDCQTEDEKEETMERDAQTEEGVMEEKDCQTEEEEGVDRDCQTDEQKEEMMESDCQTEERDAEERDCQTEEEKEDGWTQPECSLFHTIDEECQYFVDSVEQGTQFDEVEKEDGETQTEFHEEEMEREDVAVGTEEISTSEMGSETILLSFSTASSQSEVNPVIPHGVQTERDVRHRKIQTDEVKKKLKKKVDKVVVECQTGRDLLRETNCSAQTCSPPPSPPPFPVGFSVMDASTQCAAPMVTTSQTQYSSSCIRETSVQTDLNEGICAESQVDPFDVSPFSSSFLSLTNMIDVGIQTGVLARVEHMYANESRPEIIRGIAELHRSNSVNSQDSDVSSIFRGPSTVRVSPAMVGRDRRDSTESIERRPSTSSNTPAPSQHLSASISSLRSRFETPGSSSPISPSTSKEKISVDATTEKTKVKKVVKKKKTSEE